MVESGAPPNRSTAATLVGAAESLLAAPPLGRGGVARSSDWSRSREDLEGREASELRSLALEMLAMLLVLVVRLRKKSGVDGAMERLPGGACYLESEPRPSDATPATASMNDAMRR